MRDEEWIKMNTNAPSQERSSIPVVIVTTAAVVVVMILTVLILRGL